jgi:1-acyl-sn-glycerol-3-phosphate acyltransferase
VNVSTPEKISMVGRLRFLLRIVLLVVHLLMGAVLALFCGAAFVQYRRYQQPFIRWWHGRFCRILNVEVRIQGQPLDGHALWVSNHVSWLDIPGLGAHFPVYFLSKAEVAKWPIVGWLARISGTLFIKRGAGDAGKITDMLTEHLQAGRNILFFPEGTTTDGQQLKRFFHKMFAAAVEADVPVQPIVLAYQDKEGGRHLQVPFVGDDDFFSHAMGVLKTPHIVANVRVLPPEPVSGRDARSLSRDIEAKMSATLQEMLSSPLDTLGSLD